MRDIQMTMGEFYKYTYTQIDDDPLYVFDDLVYDDHNGGQELMAQYSVPDLFQEDLMGINREHPDTRGYRWLLIGPKRSGSSIHNDPLGTSAWNTLIRGHKLWFLSPPETEDLFHSRDDKESYGMSCKWLIEILPSIREAIKDKAYMVVQHPGETIFVPPFWMHAVLNLDDTIAVTQNFVSSHNFPNVWALTQIHHPRFARSWLQKLLVHHESLAFDAISINRYLGAYASESDSGKFDDDFDDDGNHDGDGDGDYASQCLLTHSKLLTLATVTLANLRRLSMLLRTETYPCNVRVDPAL